MQPQMAPDVTILMIAAYLQNVDVVKHLLKEKADYTLTTASEHMAVDWCKLAGEGDSHTLRVLQEAADTPATWLALALQRRSRPGGGPGNFCSYIEIQLTSNC